MSDEGTAIFTVWGSPWKDPCDPTVINWKEVNYVFKYGDKEYSSISNTPLPVLEDAFRPSKTVLFVCDTVVCPQDIRKVMDLNEVAIRVKEKYRNFLNAHQKMHTTLPIEVLPCKGSFPNGEFCVEAKDTYLHIVYKIITYLREFLNCRNVKLVIDLTHGLNYIPVMLYRAVKSAARYLSFFVRENGGEVRIIVTNSDPYVNKSTHNVLNINIIEDLRIPPSAPLDPLMVMKKDTTPSGGMKFISSGCITEEEGKDYLKNKNREINSKNSNYKKELSLLEGIYASFYLGFPLPALKYLNEINKLGDPFAPIKTFFEIYDKARTYRVINGKVNGSSPISLPEIAEFFLYASFLAQGLKNVVGVKRPYPVTYSLLKEVKKLVVWNEASKYISSTGIHDLLKAVCSEILRESLPEEVNNIGSKENSKCVEVLESLMKEFKPLSKLVSSSGKPDERNFIAHGGIEYNSVEVKLSIEVKYVEKLEEEFVDKVMRGVMKPRGGK